MRPEDALKEPPNPSLCVRFPEGLRKRPTFSHEDGNFSASYVKRMKKRGAVSETRAAFDDGRDSIRANPAEARRRISLQNGSFASAFSARITRRKSS
jgi:hypothetical protein